MKETQAIIYRYLTRADYFNMYKLTGTETRGGGQLYIDFLTSLISVDDWQRFLAGVIGLRQSHVRNGPQWEFPIHSIGIFEPIITQTLRVYQRRPASICIPNQNIHTRSANRVRAWSPAYGFPSPPNPRVRHALPIGLVVFLVRTYDGYVWAGWYQNTGQARTPCQNHTAANLIARLTDPDYQEGDAGMLSFPRRTLFLDESNAPCPFIALTTTDFPRITTPSIHYHRQRTENEIVKTLFSEDIANSAEHTKQTQETVIRVRRRNQNATRDLKALYHHHCQISGDRFTFPKIDGIPYTEAHHLIPLGCGGADDPYNVIIVSSLLHRMLHYASVSGIDLSRIIQQPDGSATLDIKINGIDYKITWHAEHANRIRRWEEISR